MSIDGDSPSGDAATHAHPRLVCISIVSYRTAAMVGRCLKSLVDERQRAMAQGIDISVIVVDNASGDADEVDQAIAQLGIAAWACVVRAERNGGFAYGNNVAMRRAYQIGPIPDYFWLLNPDTEVRPNAVVELVKFLERNPAVGIAGSGLESESGEFWPYAFRFPSLLSEIDAGLRIGIVTRLLNNHTVARRMAMAPGSVDWMPGASMMLRRKLVDAIGGMDESYFLYYEETDYCHRVLEAGWTIWYVPESRVMHAVGGSTGVTTARARPRRLPAYWYESRRRYFHKNYGLPYALATDAAYLVAATLGNMKQILLGRTSKLVPNQIRDVLSHSVLFPSNRRLAPVDHFQPSSTRSSSVPSASAETAVTR